MRDRIGVRVMPGTSSTLSPRYWLGALGLIATALFCAYAAPLASAALPNGRVYEQVSPVRKNGNAAGAFGFGLVYLGHAAAGGDRVMFGVTGPSENSVRGLQTVAVADRGANGWHIFDPLPYPSEQISYTSYLPNALQLSDDLSRFSVEYYGGGLVAGNPMTPYNPGSGAQEAAGIYVNDAAAHKLWWASEPKIATPIPAIGQMTKTEFYVPAGRSPDLSTLYFSYPGTLVPEDASRTPNVIVNPGGTAVVSPRGLYRWHEGELINYGSLPDGSFDPYGAVQAGGVPVREDYNQGSPANFNGQVSGDGNQAVFVSPDPGAGSGRVPQVYVRRGNGPSELVSKSELTGLPSESGPFAVKVPVYNGGGGQISYAYGSKDGSHIYFESVDALTADAPVSATEKAYMFDVATKDLVYLAGVRGQPIAAAPDLSSFVFARTANGGANKGRVGIWTGGVATTFAESPSPKVINNGHASADGKVFVFETDLAIPGFNNGGFLEEVYRYDITTEQLDCVSCPPDDVSPESNGEMGHYQTGEPNVEGTGKLDDSRGISANGNRIFFDTGDPLVKQDTNGQRDVYMWENGKVSLISSGRSFRESYYIDNSESGNDVFFTTSEGLAPADTDGSYDVYDARVGGGFTVAGPPAPCAGDCQASENAPQFSNAASTELNGAGNVKQRGTKPKCAKGKVRKQGKCVKKQGNAHKRAANAKRGSGK